VDQGKQEASKAQGSTQYCTTTNSKTRAYSKRLF
jgi:hypothetical protein